MEWRKEEQDGLTAYRRWWSKSASHAPQGEGALPVTHVDGAWTLTPVDGGARTRITYLNHMDLGGSLPDGIFSTGFVVYGYLILGRFRQAFEG
jgi:hypothetical protein